MADFSPKSRFAELTAIRNGEPDKLIEAYRQATLGLGFTPSTTESFTRMIEVILVFDQQKASLPE